MTTRRRRGPATHCFRGHELTEENRRIRADGTSECRTCLKARRAAMREQYKKPRKDD